MCDHIAYCERNELKVEIDRLRAQLVNARLERDDIGSLNSSLIAELATRDARIAELEATLDCVDGTIQDLQNANALPWKIRAERAEAERDAMRDAMRDGNRPLPYDRDHLGRLVREAWVRWAYTQPNPKPSWLVDYAELSEPDKEADRQIGVSVARWTIIGDAARTALAPSPAGREG